jgi:hypothetical protein
MSIEIKKVPFDRTDIVTQYNYDNNKRIYIAYENEPQKHYSILFPNLDWIKKHFGDNAERLNDGRLKAIEDFKTCIECNIPMWELDKAQWYEPVLNKFIKPRENRKVFESETVELKPYRLSKEGAIQFQANIDKGLLIICEMV